MVIKEIYLLYFVIFLFNFANGKLICSQSPSREIYYGRTLDVHNCNITAVSPEDFYRVNVIYAGGNHFAKLEDGLFSLTDELTNLDLNLNGIQEISVKAFSGLFKLKSLYLNKNNLTHLEVGVFDDLEALEDLNLEFNQLRIMEGSYFANNLNLHTISLSNNKILSIMPHLFNHLKELQNLNLAGNNCIRYNFRIDNRGNDTIKYYVTNAVGFPTTEEHWLQSCLENYRYHKEITTEIKTDKSIITWISVVLIVILLLSNIVTCAVFCWNYRNREDSVDTLGFFPIYAPRNRMRQSPSRSREGSNFREIFQPTVMPKSAPIYEEVKNLDLIPKKPIRKMPTIP